MRKKIKIVFFIPQLVGGGAEKVTINIMRLLNKNLFEVHLVVLSSDGPSFDYLPNDIIVHNLKASKTMFSMLKLRNLIQELSPDILFSSLFRGHIAMSFAMVNIKRKPFTILRSPNSPKLLLEHNQMNFIQKYLLEYSYGKSNLVLAQTPEMRDEIINIHKIDENKVKVLINPIDSELIDMKIKKIKNPFNINDINVVAAGRLIEQKGFDILIDAFSYVVKRNPLYKLYIIGEDVIGQQVKLEEQVRTLGLSEHIEFLGYQTNPYKYFYFSDLYVLSSRWEGLPNTVLENLYLKKPVVATKCIPFMTKLIQEGENGLLVDICNSKQLGRAILNYKHLNLSFTNTYGTKNDINNFFNSIIRGQA